MENVFWVILAHYISDYPLQGDFLAQTKGKHWYSLFVHSVIYGLTISLCFELLGVFTVWKAYVLVGSHMVIDYYKCKYAPANPTKALTTYLYIDQALHIIINIILYML